MAVLLQSEGRERERRPGHRRSPLPSPSSPRQQIGACERQRVGEQEDQVVAKHRRLGARSEQPRRRMADQGVGEGERVFRGARTGSTERSPAAGARGRGRPRRPATTVAGDPGVLGDVVSQVQNERPVHDDREQTHSAASTASSRAVTRSPASGIRGMLAGWRRGVSDPTLDSCRRFRPLRYGVLPERRPTGTATWTARFAQRSGRRARCSIDSSAVLGPRRRTRGSCDRAP